MLLNILIEHINANLHKGWSARGTRNICADPEYHGTIEMSGCLSGFEGHLIGTVFHIRDKFRKGVIYQYDLADPTSLERITEIIDQIIVYDYES